MNNRDILKLKNAIMDYKFIWNNKWIWNYESIWGIVEKFCYSNCIKPSEMFFINPRYYALPNRSTEKEHYIYKEGRYDPTLFNQHFGISNQHFEPLKVLETLPQFLYLDYNLKYCPECMKNGYHSYLHQLSFMDECIFHHCKLKCAENYSYVVSINRKQESYGFDSVKEKYQLKASNFIKNYWNTEKQEPLKLDNTIKHIFIFTQNQEHLQNDTVFHEILKSLFITGEHKEKEIARIDNFHAAYVYEQYLKDYNEFIESTYVLDSINSLNGSYLINYLFYRLIIEKKNSFKQKEFEENLLEFSSSYMKEQFTQKPNKISDYDYDILAFFILSIKISNQDEIYKMMNLKYIEHNSDMLGTEFENQIWNKTEESKGIYFILCEYFFEESLKQIKNWLQNSNTTINKYNGIARFEEKHKLPSFVIAQKENEFIIYQC